MAEKQNHKERLKEITDSIETGIKELWIGYTNMDNNLLTMKRK